MPPRSRRQARNGFHGDDTPIVTERLILTPLTVRDADEMVGLLNDQRLHEFIGGHPVTVVQLRDQYRRFVAGPMEGGGVWLNWIVRSKHDRAAVGTVQATLSTSSDARSIADVAWVIGVPWQGRGYAGEAARALIDWLRTHGVDDVTARIRPDHHASAMVARRAGLCPTDERVDGETVWRLTIA
jgi:RimJ/RimL family protein N-acetyltransferase